MYVGSGVLSSECNLNEFLARNLVTSRVYRVVDIYCWIEAYIFSRSGRYCDYYIILYYFPYVVGL
jgi:hypothetical protein